MVNDLDFDYCAAVALGSRCATQVRVPLMRRKTYNEEEFEHG
jgi:hypothetical protein